MFVLPSQLPPHDSHLRSPEMHLMAAVFEDAVRCVLRNAGARRARGWYEYLEARDWILDDRRDWPFAFANVCEMLSLDIAAVRESLRDVLAVYRVNSDRPRNKPTKEPRTLRPRRDEQQVSGDTATAERERFDVVVWDEA